MVTPGKFSGSIYWMLSSLVDGHIRGAGVGGGGVDGGRSIDSEHWQWRGRKDKDRRKQVVELE